MNPKLRTLRAYPFERLAALKATLTGPAGLPHISLAIGEPRHPPPPAVLAALTQSLAGLGEYPTTRGLPELRACIAQWLARRFELGDAAVDPQTMVLPVNGTREALFAFAQAVVEPHGEALVAMPNPLYQIYEGAALLAGAQPWYLDTTPATGLLPNLDAVPAAVWDRCQLLYLCNPGNPGGAVMDVAYLQRALQLAERHDFLIAADECYAEIYPDESQPPPSLLNAAQRAGHTRFERCVVFHSLSKRSSVPGLRSGFVAGDPQVLERFLLYRTYQGGAMGIPVQRASIAAWSDEAHVRHNRELYRQKFAHVVPMLAGVLDVQAPQGGFYLWPSISGWQDGDDERFTAELFARCHVSVVPGSYLGRDTAAGNPGRGRLRISLVAGLDECIEAARRMRDFLNAS